MIQPETQNAGIQAAQLEARRANSAVLILTLPPGSEHIAQPLYAMVCPLIEDRSCANPVLKVAYGEDEAQELLREYGARAMAWHLTSYYPVTKLNDGCKLFAFVGPQSTGKSVVSDTLMLATNRAVMHFDDAHTGVINRVKMVAEKETKPLIITSCDEKLTGFLHHIYGTGIVIYKLSPIKPLKGGQ